MNTEYYYLDQLIGAYFNQDCKMEGDTIEEIFNGYLSGESQSFEGLIKDIDSYFKQDDKALEEDFIKRYEWNFDPNLWGMTVKAFLTFVRQQIVTRLEEHHSL